MRPILLASLLTLACAHPALTPTTSPSDPPETVIAIYRCKPGSEAVLERVIQEHWATIDRLGMVLGEPKLLFRGQDETGNTIFVNIITWKSHDTPDNAPAEVQAIWSRMAPLVEARAHHPAIEYPEVKQVPLAR